MKRAVFTGQKFRELFLASGCYVFWKGDECLYVGKGEYVLNRVSLPSHEHSAARAIADRIEIYFTNNALSFEGYLIKTLCPKFNRVGLCLEAPKGKKKRVVAAKDIAPVVVVLEPAKAVNKRSYYPKSPWIEGAPRPGGHKRKKVEYGDCSDIDYLV